MVATAAVRPVDSVETAITPVANRRNALPGVRDVSTFNPQITSAAQESILRLLQGGGFSNLGTQEALIRGEAANTFRDARTRTAEAASGSGVLGSGAQGDALNRLSRQIGTDKLQALSNLRERSQLFGLQKTGLGLSGASEQQRLLQAADQLGISRDLGIRDQDLRDLISKRQASVQRYSIAANERIAANDLEFRQSALEQEIVEQNRRFGLDTTQQEINEALSQAGLAAENRRLDITEGLGLREADRLDLQQLINQQFQEFLQNLALFQMPGQSGSNGFDFSQFFGQGGGGGGGEFGTPELQP